MKTHINPQTGETFTFVKTGRETNGDYFEFIYTLEPGRQVPAKHVHAIQEETFEILSGEATFVIGWEKRILHAGESVTIPAGVSHLPKNRGTQTFRARVTFRPAHPQNGDAIFFETYCGFAVDGRSGKNGVPPLLAAAVIFDAYPGFNYLAYVPIILQKIGLKAMAWLGRRLGYKAYYPEYSDR